MRHDTGGAGARTDDSAPVALVVEDDAMVRQALARMVGGLGFHVIEAADGAAAIELLKSPGAIDLILSDVVMPGAICGRKLAAMARRLHPALPVLLITGYATGSYHVDAALAAGEILLAKPITCANLNAAVADAFERSALPSNGAVVPEASRMMLTA